EKAEDEKAKAEEPPEARPGGKE
ncbi:hypothetical protein LCGC14_1415040, partial [marine sediment metagenome]